MYSRRHVIGYRRRSASLDWLGRISLIINSAVRHPAIATFGMISGDALDIYLFYVYGTTQTGAYATYRNCTANKTPR